MSSLSFSVEELHMESDYGKEVYVAAGDRTVLYAVAQTVQQTDLRR